MNYFQGLVCCTVFSVTLGISGCGGEELPFTYRYRSASVVEIGYMGKSYVLQQFGTRTPTPFEYAFESDGDLDITIGGKSYDLDSPYDRDKKKVTTSKKKK